MSVVETPARPPTPAFVIGVDRRQFALGAIVLAQGALLWILIGRGWYLQTDFSNLVDGLGRPLTWAYLREPLGGHFGPGGRLLFWVLNKLGPLNFAATIAIRVFAQAISTILLYRLLQRLVGHSNILVAVVGLYAFSPLLFAGLSWTTSGLVLGLGQVCALLAIDLHIRRGRSGDLRFAAAAGALLALATVIGDLWIVAVLMLPILSVGFIYGGTGRERLHAFFLDWRAWIVTLLPVAGTAAVALALADSVGAQMIGFPAAYRLVRDDWLRSIGPSLVGGHTRWFAPVDTYLPYFAPTDATVLLGQLAFVVLLLIGIRRTGRRAILAWSLPFVVAVASMVIVGIGRYATYGRLIAITPRYSFVVAVPLAMGLALSLCQPAQSDPASTAPPSRSPIRFLGIVTVAAILISSLAADVAFSRIWARNPAKSYVDTLLASARAAGPGLNIYNTAAPARLVSPAEPHHLVGDLLRLGGISATYESPRSEPLIAAPDGRLAKSAFVPVAIGLGPLQVNCGTYVRGSGIWTIPLSRPVPTSAWYLRFELYQNAPSVIAVDLVDKAGRIVHPLHGATVTLSQRLEAVNLRLPVFAPVSVRVHSFAPATSLCLVHTLVGAPFPATR